MIWIDLNEKHHNFIITEVALVAKTMINIVDNLMGFSERYKKTDTIRDKTKIRARIPVIARIGFIIFIGGRLVKIISNNHKTLNAVIIDAAKTLIDKERFISRSGIQRS